jgi:hypothetical protein
LGVRVGNWLTAEEGKKLLSTKSHDNLRSFRNRALIALLIGCGLRRAEVTTLRFEDFQLREGHRVIADLRGKGGHIRTIPVPEWVKAAVDRWTLAASINAGPLLRSINKAGKIWGDGFTPRGIWAIVKVNAKSCGLPTVAPHDLRRYLCTTVPSGWRRTGADSVSAGSRLHPNDGATPPGASSVSGMRLTIASAWSPMRPLEGRSRRNAIRLATCRYLFSLCGLYHSAAEITTNGSFAKQNRRCSKRFLYHRLGTRAASAKMEHRSVEELGESEWFTTL